MIFSHDFRNECPLYLLPIFIYRLPLYENKMMWLLTPLLLFPLFVHSYGDRDISIIWNQHSDKLSFKKGFHKNFAVHGIFENAINSTGFSFLEIRSNGDFPDAIQAYAAGQAEGFLSKELIELHWSNIMENYCKHPLDEYCQKLQEFLDQNFEWMSQQILQHGRSDPFWHQVHLTLLQQLGLHDAYNNIIRRPSSLQSLVIKPDVTS